MTPQDVINGAKDLLQDTAEEVSDRRWPDGDMVRWMNEAIPLIRRRRPDAKYDEDGDTIDEAEADESALGASLCLANRWLPAMINYVVHRCYLRDAEDPNNKSLAGDYLELFNMELAT